MASTKNVLKRYQAITAGDMTGNITSPITNIQFLDNITIQLNFTGTPTGTFDVQVSDDYQQDAQGAVIHTGTWLSVNSLLTSSPVAAGVADQILLDLNQFPYPWIRIVYTATASTGVLNMFISGKEI